MPSDAPLNALNRPDCWPYPGSRWWKFDFHTHTPASMDTYWAKENASLSPEAWLLKYMAAEIDCVAITDHNHGAWIDQLKRAYAQMKQDADAGNPPDGFRELTIFPGVELSVNGGFHLLAIFDPGVSSREIFALLGAVDYRGTYGDSDGVTGKGGAEVVRAVVDAGGIAIPAHADDAKGLLALRPSTRECQLDTNTVRQVLNTGLLYAMEWIDTARPFPSSVEKQARRLANVLGSDCHSFQGTNVPGSRFSWIKMAKPTIEGLRLALLDGNGISIRRSDEGAFDPFATPAHFITRIEIDQARYMGNGKPERLELTPLYNGLIGGRGTGKSTIVHALRLAYDREADLSRLGADAEPTRVFRQFRKVAKGREDEGALRDLTEVRVELVREGKKHRLRWRCGDEKGCVVEESSSPSGNEGWTRSASQTINAERFPIRIFAQGQIAAMAGDGRRALLDIIDEASGVADLHRKFDEAKRYYFAKRANLRDFEGRLASKPEVERKLADITAKIVAFEQRQHAEVLRAHQRALAQKREVDATLALLQSLPDHIDALAKNLGLGDWRADVFDSSDDADALGWRAKVNAAVTQARSALGRVAETLRSQIEALARDESLAVWRERAEKARGEYERLQTDLAAKGVSDPNAFGRMVQERHELEAQLGELHRLERERDSLLHEIDEALKQVHAVRTEITERRKKFLSETLRNNPFVRIEVSPFGYDALAIERSLRELLDASDQKFAEDICSIEDGSPKGGMAQELASASDRIAALEGVKARLVQVDAGFGGHFRKHLRRKLEKPEFVDHVQCWFPEDDLRIQYCRSGKGTDWRDISEGSQGQRSAALLAFLLSFGDEPLVLDQPEDDLDNQLIYDLIVRQIRENKLRRQLLIVTHNPNVLVNGDAEMVHVFDFGNGQCYVPTSGALQEREVRDQVCRVMEGGREAFERRWARLGREEMP